MLTYCILAGCAFALISFKKAPDMPEEWVGALFLAAIWPFSLPTLALEAGVAAVKYLTAHRLKEIEARKAPKALPIFPEV